MNIFYCPQAAQSTICELEEGESHHLIKVLRQKVGEEIGVFDGKGHLFAARINSIAKKTCTIQVHEMTEEEEMNRPHLHIAIALPKNTDRLEWFAEKATEIGIAEITPMICEHSERKTLNLERIQKVLVSACKQSKQYTIPTLNTVTRFIDLLQNEKNKNSEKFMAYGHSGATHLQKSYTQGKDALILIGPEGDFSLSEIELAQKKGYKTVSLGKSRLRLETAGIYATAVFNLINEQ